MEDKSNKIVPILTFLVYIWWVVILIIKIQITEIPTYEMQLRTVDRRIQGLIYMIMVIFCLIMMVKLYHRYRERRVGIALTLMMYFAFSATGAFLQGFFSIFEFKTREFQTFFTDSAFIFISVTSLALSLFIIEVFNQGLALKKNKIIFGIMGLIILCANIFLTKNILGSANDLEILIPVGLSLLITHGLYLLLIQKAQQLKKRVEGEINQKAFSLIILSGIFLIFAYLFLIVHEFLEINELRYVNAGLFILGYYYLYQGFVLPMRKKEEKE